MRQVVNATVTVVKGYGVTALRHLDREFCTRPSGISLCHRCKRHAIVLKPTAYNNCSFAALVRASVKSGQVCYYLDLAEPILPQSLGKQDGAAYCHYLP
jgi:hypothetical protein